MNFKPALILSLVILTTACSSSQHSSYEANGQNSAPIFLRGDMNNWAALPDFIAHPISSNAYIVKAELQAGTSYAFKFADKDWSPATNYGAATDDKEVELHKPMTIGSYRCMNEFVFTPEKTSVYVFKLDMNKKNKTIEIDEQ